MSHPLSFLDKERSIASADFNRWLVPPAALAIHLCIGMAYGFSVFWLPLSRALGVTAPSACAPDAGFIDQLFTTQCDWSLATLGWMYTLFFVFLGCSAALWGAWLERAGPRKAAFVSALCWCGGLLISAWGVHLHQFWMMALGSGVIGGIGLGLGYISPVSTLIKWFPDRRGMATGMAIMGFGGGAMIGAPLATDLMAYFAGDGDVGVKQTFIAMALLHLAFMLAGAFGYRVPPAGYKPAGWTPPAPSAKDMVTQGHVHARRVWGIPQFWLLWMVLCMNVSAGIGVIGMASPMLQEVFGGALIDVQARLSQLNQAQLLAVASVAAGFAALLSLFNIVGRFFWASLSDRLGRKATYNLFFLLGGALYLSVPGSAAAGNLALFVAAFCIIVSMYGGAFATVPAYLADLFGTQMVGAIHGRLLTAWATAGVVGPVVVNYMRQWQLGLGLPAEQVYSQTMLILAAMLAVGLACNLLVRPLDAKWFMGDAELAQEKRLANEKAAQVQVPMQVPTGSPTLAPSGSAAQSAGLLLRESVGGPLLLALAWLAVSLPLVWGVWRTLRSVGQLFG